MLLIDSLGNPLEFSNPGPATAMIINAITADGEEGIAAETPEVFPNPVSTTLSLQFGNELPERIELSNALGQVVLQRYPASPSMEVDVSTFEPGLYILNAFTEDGAVSRKVLVE